MLDERGHEGCAGATRETPARGGPDGDECGGGKGGDGAGRPATDTERERGSGPEGDADAELLVSGGGDCGGENVPPWPTRTDPCGEV